jgi:tetratricopeptide (TPR) repeat protein
MPIWTAEPTGISGYRRWLHRQASRILERYEIDGSPFALMLQNFGITHLFSESASEPGYRLENYLSGQLERLGIGLVLVQARGDLEDVIFTEERIGGHLGAVSQRVRAPSFYLQDDVWLEAVTYLIRRAELMVVLPLLATGGVSRELETIAAMGRADRTVVLLMEVGTSSDGTPAAILPIFDQFTRVLSIADLDRQQPLSSFVFDDLVTRLVSIRRTQPVQRRKLINDGSFDRTFPAVRSDLGGTYEALAVSCRGQGRAAVSARYFGSASQIAFISGDADAAVRRSIDQADCLSAVGFDLQARSVLVRLADELLLEQGGHDPAIVYARARLVARQAWMLGGPGQLDTAIGILAREYSRCQSPLNRRASAALRTALAWTLRRKQVPAGALEAGLEALKLAQEEHDAREAARALTVLGVTWHELGDLPAAEFALRGAADLLSGEEHSYEDLWLILVRLGNVLQDAGRTEEARSVLTDAIRVAEAGSFPGEANAARQRLCEITEIGLDHNG